MKKHFYHSAIRQICDCKHLTVDQIYQKISKKYPAAGRSTIYRNVNELVENGELRKISGTQEKCLYETVNEEKHAHLINENSGKIMDIPMPNWQNLELPANFQITDIRIYGHLTK